MSIASYLCDTFVNVISRHNKTAKDRDEYRNKLAKLNNQLAEYEAELMGLRRKSDLQDTDNKKLRETNQRLRDELNNTRKVSRF